MIDLTCNDDNTWYLKYDLLLMKDILRRSFRIVSNTTNIFYFILFNEFDFHYLAAISSLTLFHDNVFCRRTIYESMKINYDDHDLINNFCNYFVINVDFILDDSSFSSYLLLILRYLTVSFNVKGSVTNR